MWCCWLCSAATWWLLFSRMKRFKSVWDTGSAVADWYFLLPGIVKKCRKNPSTTANPLHLGSTGLALWIQIPATADFEKQQQVQTSSLPCTEVQLPKNKRALVIALFDQMLCNHTAQNLSRQGRLDLRQYYGRFDLFSAITHTHRLWLLAACFVSRSMRNQCGEADLGSRCHLPSGMGSLDCSHYSQTDRVVLGMQWMSFRKTS